MGMDGGISSISPSLSSWDGGCDEGIIIGSAVTTGAGAVIGRGAFAAANSDAGAGAGAGAREGDSDSGSGDVAP